LATPWLSSEETIAAVKASGLQLADLREIPPYRYGAVFERAPA